MLYTTTVQPCGVVGCQYETDTRTVPLIDLGGGVFGRPTLLCVCGTELASVDDLPGVAAMQQVVTIDAAAATEQASIT